MRRWAPFGLLLLLIAGVAWRWSAADRAPVEDPARGSATPGGTAPGAVLAADPRGASAGGREAAPAARVTGRVLEDDRPVRARVELLSLARELEGLRWRGRRPPPLGGLPVAVAVTETDGDGRFAFDDVAEARWVVVARPGTGARGWAEADTSPGQRGGTEAHVVVRVRGGSEVLRGRVRTADGAAWRGAVGVSHGLVEAWPPEALEMRPTDAEGRFELDALPAGPVTVALFEAGRARFEGRAVVLPVVGELDLVLPSPDPQVRCTVRDAATGRPISGALVESVIEYALRSVAHATWVAVADAAGEARLPVGPEGLRVSAAGYEPAWVSTPDLPSVLDVGLRASCAVDVRVVDAATKAPVADALVVAFRRAATWIPRCVERTDGEGRCRLTGLPEGETTIFVHGGGWCSAEIGGSAAEVGAWPRALDCEVRGEGTAPVTREAVRLGVVAGRVLDATGRPVAGASVTPVASAGVSYVVEGGDEPRVTTGSDGRFEGAVLVPRLSYDLLVEAEGHAATFSGPVAAAAGERVVLDVTLDVGRFVKARVVEAGSRRPFPGARLRATVDAGSRPAHPSPYWVSAYGVSDTGGAVLLGPLPRAETLLWLDVAGGWSADTPPRDRDPPGDIEVEFELARAAFRIAGRVRFEDGSSPRDVVLELGGASAGIQGVVDEQGRFHVEGKTPGTHLLRFRVGWDEDILLEREAATDGPALDLVLPAPRYRGLSFQVLGADGSAIGSCSYACLGEFRHDGGHAERGVIRQRPFEGTVWLLVSGARDERGRPLAWAPTIAGPFTGDGRSVEVRMRVGRSVSGRVVDGEGRGVAGIRVRASALAPPTAGDPTIGDLSHEPGESTTDATGRFVLHGLDDSPWSLQVSAPKGFAEPEPVSVRGGDADVRIVLPRPQDAVVSIVDPLGRPVRGASVSRLGGSDRTPIPPTDEAGRTTLLAVSPAAVLELRVAPPPDRKELLELERAAWRRGGPPLVLPGAQIVRGLVVDAAGTPVPGAEVTVMDAEGRRHQSRSDGAGRFVADGLAMGEVAAFAATEDTPPRVSSRLRAALGSGELRLVLARGATLRVRVEGAGDEPEGLEVGLWSADGAPAEATADVGSDGVAEFEALDPRGSYSFSLTFADPPRHRVGIVRDVRGDAGEVRLRLGPPGTLVGTVRGAPVGADVEVSIEEHGVSVSDGARSDGAFALRDVPEGPFTLWARCETPAGLLVGTARGSTAAPVAIELAPAPAGGR